MKLFFGLLCHAIGIGIYLLEKRLKKQQDDNPLVNEMRFMIAWIGFHVAGIFLMLEFFGYI